MLFWAHIPPALACVRGFTTRGFREGEHANPRERIGSQFRTADWGLCTSHSRCRGASTNASPAPPVYPGETVLAEDETAALVGRARRGDREAFDALVRAFLRPAYSIALGIVRREADAEDVAQDALLLAFERLDSCREPARFGAWLFTIARNQARNWLERRKLRDVPTADSGSEPIQPVSAATVQRSHLVRALELLGAVQREVVLLHDLEGWTHEEIAKAIGISEVMSRQHLFQARKRLRSELDDEISKGTGS
jgi:RNA polymerase sigma-70 factor, ECF subfamily